MCIRDDRSDIVVRFYAIVECSMQQEIAAEMLIEQIRTEILPFYRTFGSFRTNNTINDEQFLNHLGVVLNGVGRQCSQMCGGRKEGMPNIAVVIICGGILHCGVLGNMVFTLLRKNSDSYAIRAGAPQYTLFNNYNAPMLSIENNLAVIVRSHQLKTEDTRFFIFTKESLRTLLRAYPSPKLFMKSYDDIAWSLYIWQSELYMRKTYDAPAPGFILVDNLVNLVEDDSTHLVLKFDLVSLCDQQYRVYQQEKLEKKKLLEKKFVEHLNLYHKSDDITDQYRAYLEKSLAGIWEKYNRIKKFISELLHEQLEEMSDYMKRQEALMDLQKECEQQMAFRRELLTLEGYHKKQLDEIRLFFRGILNCQNVVQYELLINIGNLEERLLTARSGAEMTCTRILCYDYHRVTRITMFLTKIEENLTNLKKTIKAIIRHGYETLQELNTLKSKVQRIKQWIMAQEPRAVQETRPAHRTRTYERAGNSQQSFNAIENGRGK
uniref:Death domain-containing protein n=1 Tax=Elaeophora elaphi TaxID=1147741 RepID=A0A0R3RQW6_9BILA